MSARRLLLTCGLIATAAWAESMPPGDYSDMGLVVRRARGSYDLFDGNGCLLTLRDPLAAQLKRYLGKFIRLDYTRTELVAGELWDPSGAPITKIRKITVLPEAPLQVTARTPDGPFSLADPVAIEFTVRNRSAQPQQFDFGCIEVNLLRDYRTRLSLNPGDRKHIHTLPANKGLKFTIRSVRMAKPGEYDAVVVLHLTSDRDPVSDRPMLSNAVHVSVRKPNDKDEEVAALLKWLPRAEPMQRVKIAERLLERGNKSGIDTVLAMLSRMGPEVAPDAGAAQGTAGPVTVRRSSEKLYSPYHVYRFVWKHGGERGEHMLLSHLKRQAHQAGARGVIEEVFRSDRVIALLHGMLSDRRETFRDYSGWCERPRICDVTASWLCGYTDNTMKFPKVGSTQERDRAVATVIAQLKKNPARFEVLTRER